MTQKTDTTARNEAPQYVDRENVFFPSGLLIFTLVLTIISTFWLSANTFQNFRLIQEKVEETLDVGQLTYRIMRLDGILTEAARLAAASGDPQWEARYNDHVAQLDEAIAKLKALSSKTTGAAEKNAAVKLTDIANIKLVEMETKTFEFVRENKLEDAQKIMNSPEYHENKEIYAKGMQTLITQITNNSKDPLLTYAKSSYYGLLPIVMSATVLAVFWFLTLRSLSIWRRELTAVRNSLHSEKRYLSTILDTMMQGVVTIDCRGNILTFSKWAETLFGYEPQEVLGQNVSLLMPEPYKSEHDKYMNNYMETGKAKILDLARETVAKSKHGTVFPIMLSVRRVDTEDEPYFVGLIMDISQQKEKELRLRQAKREADQASKAKSDFLANMSHELRTPLNSILGLTKIMLQENRLDPESRENLTIVDKASSALLNTVNDILDLSKIEAGHIELVRKPFNASGLILSLVDQIRPLASKKGITVLNNASHMSNLYLIGDEFRLFRILMNLSGNAVKYTDQGHVDINLRFEELPGNKVNFICEISDTGIGIPADKLDKIFQKFTQADETIERRYGGTGLGLSITKQLTEIMGGTIKVQSIFGQGSSFTVTIPFEKTDRISDAATPQKNMPLSYAQNSPISDARILIVEDHEFNKVLIAKMMSRLGCHDFKIVENGKLAVEAFRTNPWDIILMDLHMPEMSGHEAAQAIREIESEMNTSVRIPIIAMTADVMPGTREDCMRSGMDDYISKPIDEFYLRSALSNWFDLGETENAPLAEKKRAVESVVVTPTRPTGGDQSPPANLKIINDYAGGNPDVVKQLAATFLTKSDADIKMLESAIGSSDRKLWCDTAHKIKGSAGYMGAEKLRKLCEQAQMMIDESNERRMDTFREIAEEYERVSAFIRRETGVS